MCGSNYEDRIHVLLECSGAMKPWCEVQLWDTIDRTLRRNYNMDSLIFSLLGHLSPTQKYLFVTIMWSLWKQMNLKLWQQQNEMIYRLLIVL